MPRLESVETSEQHSITRKDDKLPDCEFIFQGANGNLPQNG